jgi:hypothetical protein
MEGNGGEERILFMSSDVWGGGATRDQSEAEESAAVSDFARWDWHFHAGILPIFYEEDHSTFTQSFAFLFWNKSIMILQINIIYVLYALSA